MTDSSKAVFLSYASQDAEAAKRMCDALRAAGIEVWFDQSELRGGDAWDRQIRKRIHDCALFIPVISANTQARLEGYFRLEWRLAVERTHLMADAKPFLMPVVTDNTRDQDAHVPDAFRGVQWSRLAGGETPPAFAERVRWLLSPGEGQATSYVVRVLFFDDTAINVAGDERRNCCRIFCYSYSTSGWICSPFSYSNR